MRMLVLATASAIALGITGAGPLYAQTTNTAPAANPGAAADPNSPTGAANPAMPAMPQAETSAPATMGSMNETRANQHLGRMSRAEIKQVQSELRRDGLYRGHIDGIDGSETHQALRLYQHRNGLRATGRLDHQTLASLLGTGTGMGSSTPPSNMSGTNNGTTLPPSSNAGTASPTDNQAPASAPASNSTNGNRQ